MFAKEELTEDKIAQGNALEGTSGAERLKSRAFIALTLETVDKPNLQLIMFPGKLASARKNGSAKVAPEAASDADTENDVLGGQDDETKEPAIDPEREETINILSDLVRLALQKTASTNH